MHKRAGRYDRRSGGGLLGDQKPYVAGEHTLTFVEDWRTAGADTFSLEEHPSVTNPVVTAALVTDVPNAYMVADPFITKVDDTFYLFFECQYSDGVTPNIGIGNYCCYATSADGLSWTYGAKIPTLPGGNYCQVFQVDVNGTREYFVVPHFGTTGTDYLDLYRAVTFPTTWEYYKRILLSSTQLFRDSQVFYYGNYWWILTGAQDIEGYAQLYYSSNLLDVPFQAHPSNPILTNWSKFRPGGRAIIRANAVDIYTQKSDVTYGQKLRAYRLTNLTPTTVTVAELATSPILQNSDLADAWNKDGMHTLDRIDSGLSVADGKILVGGQDVWSIGFYRDVP
jgi:hypothetical protein